MLALNTVSSVITAFQLEDDGICMPTAVVPVARTKETSMEDSDGTDGSEEKCLLELMSSRPELSDISLTTKTVAPDEST